MRQGPWKLVHLNVRGEAPCYELYNLDQDPGETHDVAADNPEVLDRLMQIMEQAHIPNPDFPLLPGE